MGMLLVVDEAEWWRDRQVRQARQSRAIRRGWIRDHRPVAGSGYEIRFDPVDEAAWEAIEALTSPAGGDHSRDRRADAAAAVYAFHDELGTIPAAVLLFEGSAEASATVGDAVLRYLEVDEPAILIVLGET